MPSTSPIRTIAPIGADLGEAPLWLPDIARLLWLDLIGRKVHSFDPLTGDSTVLAEGFDDPLACLMRLPGSEILLVTARRLFALEPGTGRLTPRALSFDLPEGTVFNDGDVAPDGALWLGYSDAAEEQPTGGLIRAGPDGIERVLGNVVVANGPAFAPDGSRAYFADTFARRILCFDLDPTGRPGPASLFVDCHENDGYPDGLAVDAAGHVYSARWAGSCICRYAPDGAQVERILMPVPNVTSMAFGGADMDHLFITTARRGLPEDPADPTPGSGDLWAMQRPIRGLAGHRADDRIFGREAKSSADGM